MKIVIFVFSCIVAHGRSRELEKLDFRPGSKSGRPLIRFYHGNDHFGARRVWGGPRAVARARKIRFRPGSESGPPLIRFYHGNDHFGARRV